MIGSSGSSAVSVGRFASHAFNAASSRYTPPRYSPLDSPYWAIVVSSCDRWPQTCAAGGFCRAGTPPRHGQCIDKIHVRRDAKGSTHNQSGRAPMIDLYFWPTGNGKKTVILLEELGLPYTFKPINIGRGDQLPPAFLKISPTGRMPAIVDHEPMGGGDPISIFESGAIMTYLAEKTGKFCPTDPRGKYDVAQWVSCQVANQRSKLGRQG